MKVCLDIQSAVFQRAGVGRYTKRLAESLAPLADGDELNLFSFDFKRRGESLAAPGASTTTIRWMPGRIAQRLWRTIGRPAFDRYAGPADVYHFPNFILPPLRKGSSVVTIHDLAFLRHPETIEDGNYAYLTSRIHDTVARADAVLTVSVFTAREVTELLGVDERKVVPILSGVDTARRATGEDILRMRRALDLEDPYILTVGTLEPRKNIPFAVEVFERVSWFKGDLVIAGRRGWKVEPILRRIADSPRASRIRVIEEVGEALLPPLYAAADLFLFPSLYEGFGFTPLEAMAQGTPVLSAATGSLPEVLGDAALLVKGFDPEQWADEVEYLLHDSGRRRDLREKGFAQAASFSWAETARRTWDLYRSLAR